MGSQEQSSVAEETLSSFLPQYTSWAQHIDNQGQQIGEPLSEEALRIAKEIGIREPNKVRLVLCEEVPFPLENGELKAIALSMGLIGPNIVNNAQVFGYSIYIRQAWEYSLAELAHELVHVMQIEREGSFAKFLPKYMQQVSEFGYEKAPYEAEAFQANKKYA